VDEAVRVTLEIEQVIDPGGAIATLGFAIFWLTVVDSAAVHLLTGSVTVTVYVPGVVTFFVAVVCPPGVHL
jgi:hypothetical protein